MSSEHTPSTPTPAPKAEPKAAGQTRGRLRRRVLIGLGIVSMVVVGAYLVLGRSPLTTRMVLAQLNRVQGAQVTLDHAHLGLDGALHLRGLTVTANASSDLPIQAAELLRVDRATIDLSPSGMVGSGDLVRSITLDGALARLSVDPDAGRVNSAGLAVVSGGPGGGLPVVRIRSGAIEFGEHGAGGYTVLRTVPMRAEFRPEPVPDVSAPGTPTSLAAAFSLTQTGMMLDGAGNEAPIDKPLDLTGRIDASGVNVTLSGVTLDDWPGAVPERYRRIVDLLHPEGDLRPSTLHVDPDGTISCVVRLDGVAIDLPVDTRGAIIDHGPRLRLTETYGPITITSDGYRADLRGQIDTLSYAVNLRSRGYGMDSAFNATLETTFRLDRGFGLLPFAPELVKEKLAMFGYPTGNVDRAIVHINRVAGAEPGDVEVNGELHLSDTTIRYRGFPYEVSGITGLITFTRHDMRVVRLDGRAPSGAVVHATAEFAPLGDSAEADIRVRAENVPLDDTLRDALSTDRVAMLDALFDAAEHDRLVEEGLVLPPEVRNELSNKAASLRSRIGLATPEDERRLDVLRDELAQIEKRLAAPVFAFGAKAEIDVVLHRMYGEESIWTKQIDVRLPQAGLVPSRFPLPIAARDVRIRITDDDAKLVGGSFRGLRGGGADVEASFGLSEPGDDETTPLRIAIDAWDMPIDERLLHAIPRYRLDEGERADRPGTLRDLLDRLRPSGLVSCHATIQSNGVGPLDYEVCASLDGLSASPIPFGHTSSDTSAPLDLAINTGSIEVTPERVVLRVDAEAMCHTRAPGVISELALQTSLTLGDTPSVLAVEASARGLDARLPVEHAIAVFDRDLARRYLDARDRYRPSGTVDIDAELHGPLGDAFAAVVDLRPTGETGFNHDAGRITLSEPRGSVQIVAGAEPAVGFDDFSAWISVDNVQAGLLTADGELPLARGGSDRELDAARSLALSVDHARFESAFTRRIATERLGEAAATLLDRYDPAGAFGVQLSLRRRACRMICPRGRSGCPSSR